VQRPDTESTTQDNPLGDLRPEIRDEGCESIGYLRRADDTRVEVAGGGGVYSEEERLD
jgi:hypothetical protein